jgi:hypothetical protein
MTDALPVSVVRVDTPEGVRDVVTLLQPAVFLNKGLAPEAIVGSLLRPIQAHETVTPDIFARNPVFVEFLHSFLAEHAPQSAECQAAARRQGTGWVYIIDQRTPTPGASVPPEDIVGAFQISDGHALSASYRANPAHRILSGRGFFRLGAELESALIDELTNRIVAGGAT